MVSIPPVADLTHEKALLRVDESKACHIARQNFRKRLETFSPATYFAKPTALSPLICACLGWSNIEKDLLVCWNCQGSCSIVLPSILSTEATEKLVRQYARQLVDAHAPYCAHRSEGEAYHKETSAEELRRTLPLLFASIMPLHQLQLLENPRPRKVFRSEINRLKTLLKERLRESEQLPPIILSKEVSEFHPSSDEADSAPKPTASILTRLQSTLHDDDATSIPHLVDTVAALTLFGWQAAKSINGREEESARQDDGSRPLAQFECSLCLSLHTLHCRSADERIEDIAPKRSRIHSPLDSHSHYCPFVTKWRQGTRPPLWETLATRLLQEPQTQTVDTLFLEARGLLLKALSPKFRQRAKKENVEVVQDG